MAGMFMTKLIKVSAFWRRKFSRSPRLQYSVITSTGPEEEPRHMKDISSKPPYWICMHIFGCKNRLGNHATSVGAGPQ